MGQIHLRTVRASAITARTTSVLLHPNDQIIAALKTHFVTISFSKAFLSQMLEACKQWVVTPENTSPSFLKTIFLSNDTDDIQANITAS